MTDKTSFPAQIRLLIGLGNPGSEYVGTRHNIGFETVYALLNKLPAKFVERNKFNSVLWEGRFRGRMLMLQLPQTFMNLSGKAVAKIVADTGLNPSEMMVIYDDMDLPLGKIRVRERGSSGGHRGVDSIINALETMEFPRLRLGIGRIDHNIEVDYVLSRFTGEEQLLKDAVVVHAVKALLCSLSRGVIEAMTCFNGVSVVPPSEVNPVNAGRTPEKN